MPHLTPDELRRVFEGAGCAEVAEEMISASRPGVALVTEECDDAQVGVGGSKLGGLPDLPAGMDWPRRGKQPLAFLAQIALADVPRLDGGPGLPRRGMLSMFYDIADGPWGFDPNDRDGFVVMYHQTSEGLSRAAEAPKGAYDDINEEYDTPYQVRRVKFQVVTTYPGLGDDAYEREDGEQLLELYDEMVVAGQGEEGTARHQMFGHPLAVQNPMEAQCEAVSNGIYLGDELSPQDEQRAEALAEAGAKDWLLLLQLDTDGHWTWGDMGMLYFWIKRQDLEAGDFSKVWCILQCS